MKFQVKIVERGTDKVLATHTPGFEDFMAARGQGRMMADECYEIHIAALEVHVESAERIQIFDADCLDVKGKLYSWPVKSDGSPT